METTVLDAAFIVCESVEATKEGGGLPEEANKQANAMRRQVLENDYPAAKIKTLFSSLINSSPPLEFATSS